MEVKHMKNKYKTASKALFYFSIVIIVIMVVHSIIEYQHYLQHPEYSAPFSMYMIFKFITYGIPISVVFMLSFIFKGKVIKKKECREDNY